MVCFIGGLAGVFVGIGGGRGEGAVTTKLITPHALLEMPETETTIGKLLKRGGYATAHFGKWHVGREHPSKHGFDESDGPTGNGGPENVANPNPKQALAMTTHGIDFVERQVKAGRPFYLQMSHYPSQGERGGGGRNRGGARLAPPCLSRPPFSPCPSLPSRRAARRKEVEAGGGGGGWWLWWRRRGRVVVAAGCD